MCVCACVRAHVTVQALVMGATEPRRRGSWTAFLVLSLNLGIVGASLLGNLVSVSAAWPSGHL